MNNKTTLLGSKPGSQQQNAEERANDPTEKKVVIEALDVDSFVKHGNGAATVIKVYFALLDSGLSMNASVKIIDKMQELGILFRDKVKNNA